jgi:hypothetical protein
MRQHPFRPLSDRDPPRQAFPCRAPHPRPDPATRSGCGGPRARSGRKDGRNLAAPRQRRHDRLASHRGRGRSAPHRGAPSDDARYQRRCADLAGRGAAARSRRARGVPRRIPPQHARWPGPGARRRRPVGPGANALGDLLGSRPRDSGRDPVGRQRRGHVCSARAFWRWLRRASTGVP